MSGKLSILGVKVDRVTRKEALEKFAGFMDKEGQSLIVTPNSEIILNADKDPRLKELINNAAMVIPDGIGLVIASKQLRQPLEERVTGIDFAHSALEWCAANDRKVYFLGSKPGIARKAAENMMAEIPGLQIVGARDGYFKAEEEEDVARAIAQTGAEFLCVALGSPKQELFADKYKDILGVKAAVGIGGSLDVWSGTLQRAPEFYCKYGLEWFYRLIQEPSRFKRMAKIPMLFIKVMFSKKQEE
ncbi:MAG: WecB/TagA/CpsF family glycosyltransferase [Clostridia bacterium]|nr:WecB/TagA/CpsF family glycosyltransferase [Clostridia bacterium]